MKLNKTLSHSFSIFILSAIALACVVIAFFLFFFIKNLYTQMGNSIADSVVNTAYSKANSLFDEVSFISHSQNFNEYVYEVSSSVMENPDTYSYNMEEESHRRKILENYLQERARFNNAIDFICVINNSGKVVASSKGVVEEEYITDVASSIKKINGININYVSSAEKPYIDLALPYNHSGVKEGHILMRVDIYNFIKDIDYSQLGENTFAFLVLPDYTFIDGNGELLNCTVDDVNDKYSLTQAVAMFNQQPAKSTSIKIDNKHYYMSYAPISNIGLVAAISLSRRDVWLSAATVVIPVVLLLFIIAFMFFYYRHIVSKRILYPLSLISRSVSLLKQGDLRARYNYTSNDEFGALSAAFNQTMDNLQNTTLSLREREEKYSMILDMITDVIWEYDIKRKTIKLSENWHNMVSFDNIKVKDEYSLESFMFFIHFSFVNDFKKAIRKCIESDTPINFDCRLKINETEFIWVRFYGSRTNDVYDEPSLIIGSFFNISDAKEREVVLINSAVRDDMTKLYKKGEFKRLINSSLPHSSYSRYIIMVDLDGFKQINDRYGHMIGDEIVIFAANTLKMNFERDCIISRFGGDEFTIYNKNEVSDEQIIEMMNNTLATLNEGYTTLDDVHIPIGCSFGVSKSPDDATDYDGLMEKADSAIYVSKKVKNRYTFYSSSDNHPNDKPPKTNEE